MRRRSRRKTCGGDVGVKYILLFDSGVDPFGGAFTGVDWRRMKNSSSNSIRSSTCFIELPGQHILFIVSPHTDLQVRA